MAVPLDPRQLSSNKHLQEVLQEALDKDCVISFATFFPLPLFALVPKERAADVSFSTLAFKSAEKTHAKQCDVLLNTSSVCDVTGEFSSKKFVPRYIVPARRVVQVPVQEESDESCYSDESSEYDSDDSDEFDDERDPGEGFIDGEIGDPAFIDFRITSMDPYIFEESEDHLIAVVQLARYNREILPLPAGYINAHLDHIIQFKAVELTTAEADEESPKEMCAVRLPGSDVTVYCQRPESEILKHEEQDNAESGSPAPTEVSELVQLLRQHFQTVPPGDRIDPPTASTASAEIAPSSSGAIVVVCKTIAPPDTQSQSCLPGLQRSQPNQDQSTKVTELNESIAPPLKATQALKTIQPSEVILLPEAILQSHPTETSGTTHSHQPHQVSGCSIKPQTQLEDDTLTTASMTPPTPEAHTATQPSSSPKEMLTATQGLELILSKYSTTRKANPLSMGSRKPGQLGLRLSSGPLLYMPRASFPILSRWPFSSPDATLPLNHPDISPDITPTATPGLESRRTNM
ncbi:hypothetical protein EUX98_g2468 [Antrodiella citrinella]|uniref:Uncharacterized protein n=1 Tax=Antrodiella citrinella TaxID=2447956 RepID=A0A4S4N1R5_9APHY|nr:hypothetical protein EUX98_g2468 [Antrodiella citrinella]